MSALSLHQNATAMCPGTQTYFQAVGGTPPYLYTVLPYGSGGNIDPSSGLYTAPTSIPSTPSASIDTIQATDSTNAFVTSEILIGSQLDLFCDIIQQGMGLSPGRVYLWDQKINQPTDNGLYVAVSVPMCKVFGNNISYDGSGPGLMSTQSVNMIATVDVDIISRGSDARDKKELVLMAIQSVYSEQQQEANSFQISQLSRNFINLSQIDGAAIPYRYKISMALTYFVTSVLPVQYFDVFSTPMAVINS